MIAYKTEENIMKSKDQKNTQQIVLPSFQKNNWPPITVVIAKNNVRKLLPLFLKQS
jgi:hypothetical protein